MASWKTKILDELAADLAAMGSTGIIPAEPKSKLFLAAAEAVKVYGSTLAELQAAAEDPDEKKKRKAAAAAANSQKRKAAAELKTATAAADLEYAQAVKNAAAEAEAADLPPILADLANAKAAAVLLATQKAEAAEAEADLTLAELKAAEEEQEQQAAAAAAEAAAAIFGSSSGSGSGLTVGKVNATPVWAIGKHREGKSDLMAESRYTGSFLFRTEDRAIFFCPTGEAYNGASLGKYTDLTKGKYCQIGNVADTKAASSLTGLVRWCREWIYTADLDQTAEEHTDRINERAEADNLFKNAGGTVYAQPATQEQIDLIPAEA